MCSHIQLNFPFKQTHSQQPSWAGQLVFIELRHVDTWWCCHYYERHVPCLYTCDLLNSWDYEEQMRTEINCNWKGKKKNQTKFASKSARKQWKNNAMSEKCAMQCKASEFPTWLKILGWSHNIDNISVSQQTPLH